jgi:ribulose-phosphate 3-epimerase
MIQIIPSLLVPDQETFIRELTGLGNSVNQVQIDIADGIFVQNKTWSDPETAKQNLKLDCELHLMVVDPTNEAKKWQNVPQVKKILVHFEAIADSIETTLPELLNLGWKVGLVLNPETQNHLLEPYLNSITDVMFMGVNPGKQGSPFIPSVLEKIKNFKTKYPNYFVELDGAVNENTLPEIIKSGVDAICPGSAIFGNERSPIENVERMKEMIERLTVTK